MQAYRKTSFIKSVKFSVMLENSDTDIKAYYMTLVILVGFSSLQLAILSAWEACQHKEDLQPQPSQFLHIQASRKPSPPHNIMIFPNCALEKQCPCSSAASFKSTFLAMAGYSCEPVVFWGFWGAFKKQAKCHRKIPKPLSK